MDNIIHDSIKLNCETVFHHHLSQNQEKLELYNKAVQEGKITDFDQTVLTRLRKLYFGFYSGLMYMYIETTNNDNIGNKAELMTFVFEDKDYELIHGETDSIREIPFSRYGLKRLECNSWLEVREGQKVWVYDLFSMLKIEKNVYYQLEKPNIKRVVSKNAIMSHPGRDNDDYQYYHDGMNFMLIEILPKLEQILPTHPYGNILAPEITKFKKDINFENIILETNHILEDIKKSH